MKAFSQFWLSLSVHEHEAHFCRYSLNSNRCQINLSHWVVGKERGRPAQTRLPAAACCSEESSSWGPVGRLPICRLSRAVCSRWQTALCNRSAVCGLKGKTTETAIRLLNYINNFEICLANFDLENEMILWLPPCSILELPPFWYTFVQNLTTESITTSSNTLSFHKSHITESNFL